MEAESQGRLAGRRKVLAVAFRDSGMMPSENRVKAILRFTWPRSQAGVGRGSEHPDTWGSREKLDTCSFLLPQSPQPALPQPASQPQPAPQASPRTPQAAITITCTEKEEC